MRDLDFAEGKEFGSTEDCRQENNSGEGEDSSCRWIQTAQVCKEHSSWKGEEW